MEKANILEIFSSIQGEGPYVGLRQLFIRFSSCNLKCGYCDTLFEKAKVCNVFDENKECKIFENPLNTHALLNIVEDFYSKYKHHSISLTGGEPLMHVDFLQNFLNILDEKIYLETNGTLYQNLAKVIDLIDIISMDIKLESSTKQPMQVSNHKKFIEIAKKAGKEIFVKTVITSQIKQSEIEMLKELLEGQGVVLILQPVSTTSKVLKVSPDKLLRIEAELSKVIDEVRVIPQTHKFIDVL